MSDYDVVVVGGGAAGLSAALVLSRARRKTLVLDAGHPRNAPAATCRGFSPATGCRPPSCWPTAATKCAATAAGSSPARSRASPRATGAGSGCCSAAATRSRHDRCSSPPAFATSSPTSRGCVNAGPATCCTARTATATKYATAHSASSAEHAVTFEGAGTLAVSFGQRKIIDEASDLRYVRNSREYRAETVDLEDANDAFAIGEDLLASFATPIRKLSDEATS